MSRYTGPKNRKSRALGRDLGLKTNSVKVDKRLQVKPGQHGPKAKRSKMSDYGKQLREKQKVRWMYGIVEKQFRNYFEKALKNPQATGVRLLQLLELRLDNVIYRLKLAPTRNAARQMVSHGHVRVNGKKVTIPSYQVSIDDAIDVTEKMAATPVVKQLLSVQKVDIVGWLDRKATVGKIVREPDRKEIDLDIEESLIVEYYSR